MSNSTYKNDYQVKILGKNTVYTGEVRTKDYNPHGFGTAKFENGDEFKGFFSNGDPTYGTYTFSNGSYCKVRYEYNFSRSKYYTYYLSSGFGFRGAKRETREDLSNGYYLGEMKNNVAHGIGKYVWSDGDTYVGGWLNGKKHGVGKFTWSDGDYDWSVYIEGEEICVLDSYSRGDYQEQSYSYDYNDSDDSYDTSYAENDYTTTDRLFDDALDKINNGSSEEALAALKNLRSYCDADDYYIEDEMGYRRNIDEEIREIENDMNYGG